MAVVEKFIQDIADNLGATEMAIRFLLSLFAGYPLAFLYRSFIFGRSPNIQHIYFTICGISLCYFNYGTDVVHSMINIAVTYILLLVCPGSKFSILFGFIFNSEGVCILNGLSYNGKDENGNILWDGIQNVKLYPLETATSFHGLISAFNINTNLWMAKYLFKRLRFMGSKLLSQSVTLFYLALWHGLKTGYYMNFFLEFFMVNTENQMTALSKKVPAIQKLSSMPSLQPFVWVVKKTFITFSLSYALVSFGLLEWNKYFKVYGSIYYIGHVIFMLVPLVVYLFAKVPISVYTSHRRNQSRELKEEKVD
ncbi:lysophospholipid acyltransferase 5 [Mytilus galloprovincialis]|uniref:Lysophospholipid acyltransferase 5 n=1 Tax=Mytilus galloprovincialis TaxID=29158 RepID=A0A8B6DVM4_MYTGA|nr:lysophospholipid acyltransferase 5 [Mytilus galloprovincialis]